MIGAWTLWLLVAIGPAGSELGSQPYLSAEGCATAVRRIARAYGHAVVAEAAMLKPTESLTLFRSDGAAVTFSCRLDGDDTGE